MLTARAPECRMAICLMLCVGYVELDSGKAEIFLMISIKPFGIVVMVGYRSTRWRGHTKKSIVEDCHVLDSFQLVRELAFKEALAHCGLLGKPDARAIEVPAFELSIR